MKLLAVMAFIYTAVIKTAVLLVALFLGSLAVVGLYDLFILPFVSAYHRALRERRVG
jgi:hypothetical protein